jgi:hypothetical protein
VRFTTLHAALPELSPASSGVSFHSFTDRLASTSTRILEYPISFYGITLLVQATAHAAKGLLFRRPGTRIFKKQNDADE